jgi:hypothetical protein
MKSWRIQLEKAVQQIQKSHLPLAEKCAARHGSGIGIFKYLWEPKRDGSNCIFRYCIKNGSQWNKAKTLSRDASKRLASYTPETMIAVAILVPTSFYPEAQLVGDVYLYTYETHKRVNDNGLEEKTAPPKLIRNRSYLTQI